MTIIAPTQGALSNLTHRTPNDAPLLAEGNSTFSTAMPEATVPQSPRPITDRPKVEDPAVLIPFYESEIALHKSRIEGASASITMNQIDYESMTKVANERLAEHDEESAAIWFATAESAQNSIEGARMELFELGKQAPYIENIEQRPRALRGQS